MREPGCSESGSLVLNHKGAGMLSVNHIKHLIRKRVGVSVFRKDAYIFKENACDANSETATGSYTETI